MGPALLAARHIAPPGYVAAGIPAGSASSRRHRGVRNRKDLNFYRPTAQARYRHTDALFGEPGRNVIDWDLIEAYYPDVMRVVLSVQEGKISSATLLRRLSTYSRRNNIYWAFREIGRGIRTVQLLRFLRRPAQKAHHRRDQQGRVVQQVLLLVPVRQRRRDRGQRPRRAGEDPEVLHAAGQRGHPPHHRGHDDRHPRADRRALADHPRGPGRAVPIRHRPRQRFGVYATDEIALTPNRSTPASAWTSPAHPDTSPPAPAQVAAPSRCQHRRDRCRTYEQMRESREPPERVRFAPISARRKPLRIGGSERRF